MQMMQERNMRPMMAKNINIKMSSMMFAEQRVKKDGEDDQSRLFRCGPSETLPNSCTLHCPPFQKDAASNNMGSVWNLSCASSFEECKICLSGSNQSVLQPSIRKNQVNYQMIRKQQFYMDVFIRNNNRLVRQLIVLHLKVVCFC